MKSCTLKLYSDHPKLKAIGEERQAFIDEVYAFCEEHYSAGGDTICECYAPWEIDSSFKTLDDVKRAIGLYISRELDARWGDDDDPQLERAKRFDEEIGEPR